MTPRTASTITSASTTSATWVRTSTSQAWSTPTKKRRYARRPKQRNGQPQAMARRPWGLQFLQQ
eukprot:11192009-Lingulodinium_polyedra.AAC.1